MKDPNLIETFFKHSQNIPIGWQYIFIPVVADYLVLCSIFMAFLPGLLKLDDLLIKICYPRIQFVMHRLAGHRHSTLG